MSVGVPTRVNIQSDAVRENWANAVAAVEEERGAELSRAGRPAADELTAEEVLDELCTAYTGHDVRDGRGDP